MLLERHNWIKGYQQILNDCRPSLETSRYGSCGTVLILCNPDADALCAARILSYAFRADNVLYQLRPCTGMKALVSILESLNLCSPSSQSISDDEDIDSDGEGKYHGRERLGSQEGGEHYDFYNEWNDIQQNGRNTGTNSAIRSIILLNFGATKNLNTILYGPRSAEQRNVRNRETLIQDDDDQEDEREEEESLHMRPPLVSSQIKTFVLDSHRPYHLANVYAGKNIVLLNDYNHWHDDVGGMPSDGDGLSGDEEEESSDEDEDEESDEEDSDQETGDEGDSDEGEAEFEDEGAKENEKDIVHEDHGHANDSEKKNSLKRRSDYDGEGEGDNDSSIERSGKRQRQDDPDTPATEASTDDEDDNGEVIDKSDTKNIQSVREHHQIRRDHIQKYYEGGSFHSSPVSIMAYDLSRKIRHDSVGDLLWLACVGVTDAYIHNRLDLSGYIKLSIELQEHVKNMYPDDSDDVFLGVNQGLNHTFYAEELYTRNSNDNSQRNNGAMTQVGFSENGRILIQKDEFQFFLLRHLSLWDAMYLSPLVNTKMLLWRQSGIQKLKEMLAKMGLPLNQCKQPYAFMKPGLKRRLKLTVMEHADDYGLDNLSYTGFLRITGYKSLLSASDVAYAVTALLECETKYNHRQIVQKSKKNANGDRNLSCTEQEYDTILMNSFNTAYDALNSNASSSLGLGRIGCEGLGSSIMGEGLDLSSLVNGGDNNSSVTGIGAGLRLAALLQSAIVSTAMGLVERKAIYRLTQFRYAFINTTSQGANGGSTFTSGSTSSNKPTEQQRQNHHIFSKPLALTKLAIFLMDMHRKNNKWTGTKARPLVLLAENPQTQTYLVVGYEFPEERGSTKKNKFEQKFKLATDTMQGTFHYDSFEANVVEVKSSDVKNFLEHLHYMADSL